MAEASKPSSAWEDISSALKWTTAALTVVFLGIPALVAKLASEGDDVVQVWRVLALTAVTFIENYYDPDPGDSTYEATFIYLIREAGRLRVERDQHILGLFSLAEWPQSLRIAGFTIHEEPDTEFERLPPIFVCLKA